MNVEQAELYQRIQAFSLDEPDANFPFGKRLARDNGWSAKYTQRVIEEYKKFVFLAVVAGHPVTPSDQVDQVWHLHLVYTHSYWGEFCPNILQMPLHHGPTRGGKSEHHKFNDWYSKTLASYESFFGQTPPIDIWPPLQIRFGRDVHFVRVNTQQTWLVPKFDLGLLPKPRLNRAAIVTLLFVSALSLTSCEALLGANIRNPLDFNGSEFLRFYLLVASAVILFAYVLRWYLRKPANHSSQESVSLDTYETAYLAGGKDRAIDVAIASLVQRGHLTLQPGQRTLLSNTPLPKNSHALELVVEQAVKTYGKPLSAAVTAATDVISKRLQSFGLLMTERQAQAAQHLPAIPIFALLLLGISKILVGISRGKPVGFLVVLCFITAIIGCCFFRVPVQQRSRYGDRILAKLRTQHANLRRAKASDNLEVEPQLALAFALFGAVILKGSPLANLTRDLYAPLSSSYSKRSSRSGSGSTGIWWGGSDGGGDSCGGDGGGGGCGGGGCGGGGCGGCGGG